MLRISSNEKQNWVRILCGVMASALNFNLEMYEFEFQSSYYVHFWTMKCMKPLSTMYGLVCFVWFYGISTFVGYLTPNPFLC